MDRNLDKGRLACAKGLVDLDFSFLANNVSNPLVSSWRGTDVSFVESIAYSAVGILLVTLSLGCRCRYMVTKDATIEDLNAADDGAYATIGAVQNEGSSTAKMTFKIYTRAANGTKTDFTGRRVSVHLVLKNSTVGV